MDKVKIRDARPLDKVRELINKVYGLKSSEYEVMPFDEETVVEFHDSDKAADSKVIIEIRDGGFQGFLNLYPPLHDGRLNTFEDVMQTITTEGVFVTVEESVIKKAVERMASGDVVEGVLIAEGIKPVPGHDAEITIQFSKGDKRPKMVDGKIDYKNLDNIPMVYKGDVLLTKKPASAGVRGMNIKHEEVVPVPGKDSLVLPGDGATVNDTGTIYTAMIDGYVDYGNKRLAVYPVYNIKGNVDYSTGNINFNGSVHVHGDVLSGFKIEASRHILVDGICQDCELFARGNVILRTGMKGTGAGFINAGGSVIVGYCEKAKVYAKENIEIKKYSFNSDLFAGMRLDALAGEGIVAGGTVRAFQDISVKQLGTQGNLKFNVIVGTKYFIEFEFERLKREKQRIIATAAQVNDALSKFDLSKERIASHPKIKKMVEVRNSLSSLLKDIDNREAKLMNENTARNPRIKVRNKVFEGVSIVFYNVASVIKEPLTNVVFYFDQKYKEVAWVSMKDANSIELNEK